MEQIIIVIFILYVIMCTMGVGFGYYWKKSMANNNCKSEYDPEKVSELYGDDHTFGVRLLGYLKMEFNQMKAYPMIYQEEYEYLCIKACNILRNQWETLEDPRLLQYFQNMVPECTNYDEFMQGWYKGEFINYLKDIRAYQDISKS